MPDGCDRGIEFVEPLGDAEVGQPRLPVGSDEDVRGLHIAVHDAGSVSRSQHRQHLTGQTDRLVDRERTGSREVLGQRRPVDELHDDEEVAVVLAGVEHGHRVPMVESGGGLTLAQEPFASGGIGRGDDTGVEEFDRHPATESLVDSGVHPSRTAGAELLTEHVSPGQSSRHDDDRTHLTGFRASGGECQRRRSCTWSTRWWAVLCTTSDARSRVGAMFSRRFRPLMSRQMRRAVSTASSSLSSA